MGIGLWIIVAALTIALAYVRRFSAATRSMGRELGRIRSTAGLQDAITPPWQTSMAFAIYVGIVVAVGSFWWWLGWILAIAAVATILIGSSLVQLILPRSSGEIRVKDAEKLAEASL